jgi:hypothetical protein
VGLFERGMMTREDIDGCNIVRANPMSNGEADY